MAVDREFYVYRFGRPRPGRTDGRADGDGRRTDGRTDGGRTGGRTEGGWAGGRKGAAGMILNDSTTIFIDFHKNHPKTLCFSVVSRPAEAQVPIFTGQMKKASKKRQKSIVFFDFSNHARAQVPIFTPKMKNFGHGRRATGSSGSTRNATRSVVHNPRNTRARGQDDGSSKQTPSK